MNGERCTECDPSELEAHHLVPVSQGGENVARTNGVTLCKRHHLLIEAAARKRTHALAEARRLSA